jgi:hypothetical protein
MNDKPIPLCKIARETGGDVPLACLFECHHGCLDNVKPPPPPPVNFAYAIEGLESIE